MIYNFLIGGNILLYKCKYKIIIYLYSSEQMDNGTFDVNISHITLYSFIDY